MRRETTDPKKDVQTRKSVQPRKKVVRVPTPESLAAAALFYLGRYAASEARLRRVLDNKIRRAAQAHPSFAADAAAQSLLRRSIDAIVDRHKKSGVINDAAFADMKVRGMRRAGASARRMTEKLRASGIDSTLSHRAIETYDQEENGDTERAAAMVLMRKRGIGPYRRAGRVAEDPAARRAQKQKDQMVLLRYGFSFDLVRDLLGDVVSACDD